MNAVDLLAELARFGIRLEADGDRLRYFPRALVTPVLLARLQTQKAELIGPLRSLPDWPTFEQVRNGVWPEGWTPNPETMSDWTCVRTKRLIGDGIPARPSTIPPEEIRKGDNWGGPAFLPEKEEQ